MDHPKDHVPHNTTQHKTLPHTPLASWRLTLEDQKSWQKHAKGEESKSITHTLRSCHQWIIVPVDSKEPIVTAPWKTEKSPSTFPAQLVQGKSALPPPNPVGSTTWPTWAVTPTPAQRSGARTRTSAVCLSQQLSPKLQKRGKRPKTQPASHGWGQGKG